MAGFAASQNVEINLKLFGSFEISDHDGNLLKLRSSAEYALLAYLAIESDRAHSRDFLGGLIWMDLDEEKTRNNIRVSLSRLRKVLRGNRQDVDVIVTSGQLVSLNSEMVWTDVAAFSKLFDQSTYRSPGSRNEERSWVGNYLKAAAIFRGEFLQGFSLTDSLPFLEWMTLQQERFHRQAIVIFDRLANYYLQRGELEEVASYADRQLELEPWREEAHRQLMRYYSISGQKNNALAQYERCEKILQDELGVSPSVETEDLYRRIQKSRHRKKPIVPAASSRFIGRQGEQAQIVDMLSLPECRLLTIVGLGGVGKTRLASQITLGREYAFWDGAVFVSLANLRRAARIPEAIAEALDFSFGGKRDPHHQLIDFLEDKEYLLVLDNFEHLLDGTVFLTEVWEKCQGVKMLITSRERLGVANEWLFNLNGLPVAEDASAVDLLVACIRKYEPGYSPGAEMMSSLQDLAQKVEGMPLALELVAPMVRMFSIPEILANLEEIEKRGLEPVFDRSWVLLSKEEQAGLSALSIFKSSFTQEAAWQVAGVDVGMLTGFIDKSLLHRVDRSLENNEDQVGSLFDFHPLVKQYLEDKLFEKDESIRDTSKRHAMYFLTFLEEMHGYLYSPEEIQAIRRVMTQYEDVRLAMNWGAENDRLVQVRKGLRFFIHYFESLGAFSEGRDFFGQIAGILNEKQVILNERDDELAQVLSRAYWFYGWHQMRMAEEDLALNSYKHGLRLARQSNAEEEEAGILNAIALLYRHTDLEKSNHYLAEALEIGHRIEHGWHIASFNNNLGINAMLVNKFGKAGKHFEEALMIFRQINHYWGIIGTLSNLGQLQMHLNNNAEAQEILMEALLLVEEYDYHWLRIKILVALGDLAYSMELWPDAVAYYQQAFESIESFGDKTLLKNAKENLSIALKMTNTSNEI